MTRSAVFFVLAALPASAQTWSEEAALTAPVPAPDDEFALSVALDGDTAVVGAPGDDTAGADAGAAYVYVRSGTLWSQQTALLSSSPDADDRFGHSVSLDGDTLVVGSPGDDVLSGVAGAGVAYVFVRSGTTWSEQAVLGELSSVVGAAMGVGVAVQGDVAIVGADLFQRFRFYERSGTSWTQEDLFLANTTGGVAPAISGNWAFVGLAAQGEVRIYERTTSSWVQRGVVPKVGVVGINDNFGKSVAARGDVLVVGVPRDDASLGKQDTGSAHVYARQGTSWVHQAELESVDPQTNERFGRSVALDGDLIAAGATLDKGTGTAQVGAAHLFGGRGAVWAPLGQLTKQSPAAGDRFGITVALSGGRVLAGAVQDDPGGVSNAGGAYLFAPSPGPTTYCTAGTSASGCAATISAIGVPSASAPSGFVALAENAEGAKSGLFIYGAGARQANPWGSGTSLRCFVPPVNRGKLRVGKGLPGTCDGWYVEDLNARWCPSCPRPQHNPGAGNMVRGQLWYRDPFNTSGQETGLSDAFEAVVAP